MSRDFCDVITDLAYGQVHQQLSEHLREIVQAVEETGLPGKLQLTLQIKREGKVATVGAKVAKTVPQPPLPGSIFFFAADGSLHRDDPKQALLPNVERLPDPRIVSIEERNGAR